MWRVETLLRLGDISARQQGTRRDNQFYRLQYSAPKGNLEARGTAAGISPHAEAQKSPVIAMTLACLA